jgi:hypothetical protein
MPITLYTSELSFPCQGNLFQEHDQLRFSLGVFSYHFKNLLSERTLLKKKNKRDAGAQLVSTGKFRYLLFVGRAVCGGQNFPSSTYCAPASRLAFVTVYKKIYYDNTAKICKP